MKKCRKITSLLLIAALVLSLGMSSMALADTENTIPTGNGTITISNAAEGETYTIYEILHLESYSGTNFSYKVASGWEDFVSNDAKDYLKVENGYVTWAKADVGDTEEEKEANRKANAAAFAKMAKAYAAGKTSLAKYEQTATADGELVFSNLDLGYYLVDTSLGALCSLDTTTPTATINDKNEEPTVDKQVLEGTSWGEKNDASIGDTVEFKTTIHAKKGATNYVLHDTLSAGLTLIPKSIKVGSVRLTNDDGAAVGNEVGTVSFTNDDKCSFEIKFKKEWLDKNVGATDTDIIVYYSATLNGGAVIKGAGNPNKTHLTYGDSQKTNEDSTITYTYNFEVLKYANGNEAKVLAGAEFVLLNSDQSKVAIIENNKITSWVDKPTEKDSAGNIIWDEKSILKTGSDGKIHVDGIDSGDYKLLEIKAPEGFNLLKDPVNLKILAYNNSDYDASKIHVEKINNNSGTQLPSTGGIGTTIFYAVGSILVLGAGVLLVTRKRMSTK